MSKAQIALPSWAGYDGKLKAEKHLRADGTAACQPLYPSKDCVRSSNVIAVLSSLVELTAYLIALSAGLAFAFAG
jgi:hypothetical protein